MNYKGYEDGIIRGSIGLGVDYYKGEKGDNGVSPTISVVEIPHGHRIIINDVDGEKSFDILDGEGGEGGGKGIITRSAEIAYNQVEDNIYRWQTIVQPDFTGVNDFDYVRVSLKATHNDVSRPYSTYLTLYPNKPGTSFCGYYDGGIYTLTKIGSNWQGGCVDLYRINNKANQVDGVKTEIGELYDLLTEDTSSIVGAINEVQNLAMSNHYTLPTATTSTLGGVKVDGNTITIDGNGVISATSSGSGSGGSGVVYTAGYGINIENGEISVDTEGIADASGIASQSYVDDAVSAVSESIPTNVSELTNDAGYLTSFTETDPTVPNWAKQSTKPTYTAVEVGALPADTAIPQAISDLVNDSDFATESYVDTAIANIPSSSGDDSHIGWDEPIFAMLSSGTINGFTFDDKLQTVSTVADLANALKTDKIVIVDGSVLYSGVSPSTINAVLETSYDFYNITLNFSNQNPISREHLTATDTTELVQQGKQPVFLLINNTVYRFDRINFARLMMGYNLGQAITLTTYGKNNTVATSLATVMKDYDNAITALQNRLPTGDIATESYVDTAVSGISATAINAVPVQATYGNNNFGGSIHNASHGDYLELNYTGEIESIAKSSFLTLAPGGAQLSSEANNLQINGLVNPTNPNDAANKAYVDTAIANIPSSGGSSYTFTNGLTENDGTVSWDLNDRVRKGTGTQAVIEGASENTANGDYSHAEGHRTQATSEGSHAEGIDTAASHNGAHAEGSNTRASGPISHAEGFSTNAASSYSHAEGSNTSVSGYASHAEGMGAIASGDYQHAEGKYNIPDTTQFQSIVGNGTDNSNRSNMFARDWSGNEYLTGNLFVGCNDYSANSSGLITENAGGSKVATETYVDTAIANIPSSGSGESKKSNLTEPIFNLFTKDNITNFQFGGTPFVASTIEELVNHLNTDGIAVVNGYSLYNDAITAQIINTAMGTSYKFYKFTLENSAYFVNSAAYPATSTTSLVEFQKTPVFVLGEDRIMIFASLANARIIMGYNLEQNLYTNSYGRTNTNSSRLEQVLTDYDNAITEVRNSIPSSSGSEYTAGDGISIDENNEISAKTNPLIFSMLQMTTAGNNMPLTIKLDGNSTWEEFVENIKAGKVVYISSTTSYTFNESYKLTAQLLGVSTLYGANVADMPIPMMGSTVAAYSNGTQVYYSTYYFFDGAFLWCWKRPEDLGNFIKVRYRNSMNTALGYALQQITTDMDTKFTAPSAPTTDGNYTLKCVVSNGTPTYSWVSE